MLHLVLCALSVLMLQSEMSRLAMPGNADLRKRPKWEYTDGLECQAALACARAHPEIAGEARAWVQKYLDYHLNNDGTIKGYDPKACKLDCINPGKVLLEVYVEGIRNKEQGTSVADRLRRAIDLQYSQLAMQPRTAGGGFWHKTVYPHQMWLDGIYMAEPFYARYAQMFLKGEAQLKAYEDILAQFREVTRHTYDPKTGLYRHGWDEAKAQVWADPVTGQSRHAWGRALGWFAAALADTIPYLPDNYAGRAELEHLAQDYAHRLARWQDPSGAFWQVADEPGRKGNYLEATATALIAYAMLKGWNDGYLDEAAKSLGQRALAALDRDFIKRNPDGTISLTRCCAVAGLSQDRDGSFEYYLREPIRDNDSKGTGPYILAHLEQEKMEKVTK